MNKADEFAAALEGELRARDVVIAPCAPSLPHKTTLADIAEHDQFCAMSHADAALIAARMVSALGKRIQFVPLPLPNGKDIKVKQVGRSGGVLVRYIEAAGQTVYWPLTEAVAFRYDVLARAA